jgi:CRP-like cAMP-binding protein
MSLHEEIEMLRGVPPFAPLGNSKLKLLAFASERLQFSPAETLVKQGEIGDSVYVVISGTVDVTLASGGEERFIRSLGEHAFIGEVAVLENTPRTATVTAKTDVVALKISKDVLFRMIQDLPNLGIRISRHQAKADYVFE